MKNAAIALILVLILAGVGYYISNTLATPAAPASTLGTTGSLNPNGTPSQKFDFARALLNINTVKLDVEFFKTDAAWASLQDFTTLLREPVKGRRNPFSPLDVVEMGTSTPQ